MPCLDGLMQLGVSGNALERRASTMPGFSLAEGKTVGGGSVSITYIMQSFHKFIVSLFCPIPLPMRAALYKLFVEVGLERQPNF